MNDKHCLVRVSQEHDLNVPPCIGLASDEPSIAVGTSRVGTPGTNYGLLRLRRRDSMHEHLADIPLNPAELHVTPVVISLYMKLYCVSSRVRAEAAS